MSSNPTLALNIEQPNFKHTVEHLLHTPKMQRELTTIMPTTDSQRAPSLISEGHILQMILDDIKYVKHTLETHTAEEREEFRRIIDKQERIVVKIDKLEKSLREEMKAHSVDITRLQTKMKFIAWVSGAIAGLASSLMLAFAKHMWG